MLEMIKPYIPLISVGSARPCFAFYFDRDHNTQRMSLKAVLGHSYNFFQETE